MQLFICESHLKIYYIFYFICLLFLLKPFLSAFTQVNIKMRKYKNVFINLNIYSKTYDIIDGDKRKTCETIHF